MSYSQAILHLKNAYNQLHWSQKIFFPRQLAVGLENYPAQNATNEDSLDIFRRFNSIVSTRLFSSLKRFYQNRYTTILRSLSYTDLLTGDGAQANFDAVIATQYPMDLALAFISIDNIGLFRGNQAQANFDALVTHQEEYLGRALLFIRNTDLLRGTQAQANFDAIVAHQNPYNLAQTLEPISNTNLLRNNQAQNNFVALVTHQNPYNLALVLYVLGTSGLLRGNLAQTNFNALITHEAILCHQNNHHNGVSIWEMMPDHRPTALEFQRIILIAQEHAENPDDGSGALMAYINANILNIVDMQDNNLIANRQDVNFNPNQSTHTASVHASVSESAIKLFERYKNKITDHALDDNINALSRWIHAHEPKDNKQKAAGRCIERLTHESYIYTDSVSKVSMKQLLALVWIGINDENARFGALEDAKNQLIEGLYEIQRGYNISKEVIDNNEPDESICTAGTFNKLIEKLAGVHCDVTVLYITKEVATTKLKIVAIEQAQEYLDNLPLDEDIETLKNKINDEDMDYLWNQILPKVKVRMFDEFSSLYPEGIDSDSFNNDVNSGIYALTSDAIKLPTTPSVCSNHNTFFGSQGNDTEDESKQSEDNFINTKPR